MTKEEKLVELRERHQDELNDIETYMNLSKECPIYGSILRDIACDEESHAKYIKYIIDKLESQVGEHE